MLAAGLTTEALEPINPTINMHKLQGRGTLEA
jgi:hypothetical protein